MMLKLHPDRNGAPGASDALRAVSIAYNKLIDNRERSTYDNQLKNGEGTISVSINDAGSELGSKSGFFWNLLRFLLVIVGIIFLLVLVIAKFFRNSFSYLKKNVFRFKSNQKQMEWCASCGEYHTISNEEGEMWEEDGKYYYKRDGKVHDITSVVKSGLLAQVEDLDGSDSSDQEYGRNTRRKIKKKKQIIRKRR